MKFNQKLNDIQNKNNSLLCVGLDPERGDRQLFTFNKSIIDSTLDLVCAYKPNIAFYEALGIEGLKQLKLTIDYIKNKNPDMPIILDAKRGDIGNTAKMYAKMAFEYYGVNAMTVNPYMGMDTLEPYLYNEDNFIIVLVKTSNPGAEDFQNTIYLKIASKIKNHPKSSQMGVVVGATYPEELSQVRKLMPDTIFLIPGIGSQGGDMEKTIKNGINKNKSGIIVNVARSVINAQNPREEAEKIKNQINIIRNI